jgi:hypothetical protein
MKHILKQIAILLILTCASHGADYMALKKNQSYTIPAGKVVEVMAFTTSQGPVSSVVGFRVDGKLTLLPTLPDGTRLPGPTNLSIIRLLTFTYRIEFLPIQMERIFQQILS